MQRKAQGLSLNTMVIAAIVLIVLVVILGLLSGFFEKFMPGWDAAVEKKCEGRDGLTERRESEGCESNEERVYENFGEEFERKGSICCRVRN